MPVLDWIGKKQVINHDKEVPFRLLKRVESSGMQGYRPSAFNPYFILETKPGTVVALEYKGEHLADREYKEEIGNIWGGLNEKYKFMMVTKIDIESKINKLTEFYSLFTLTTPHSNVKVVYISC